jgi:hypothetical protein
MSRVHRRRRLTDKQLAYFQVMRHFRKAWKTMPEYMERCRARATKAAQAKRHAKHKDLIGLLSELPEIVSTEQIAEAVKPYYRKHRMASMFNRIRRHRLMVFDPGVEGWRNLCRLRSNDTVQES